MEGSCEVPPRSSLPKGVYWVQNRDFSDALETEISIWDWAVVTIVAPVKKCTKSGPFLLTYGYR